jgi:hypothetical protein
VAKIGAFVRAKTNDWGVGKLVAFDLELGTAEVEYFPSAASSERPRETFRFSELGAVKKLSAETRVYFFDVKAGTWCSGRLHWQAGEDCFVDLPNRRQERVDASDLFVRWWRPLSDCQVPRQGLGCFDELEALQQLLLLAAVVSVKELAQLVRTLFLEAVQSGPLQQ